MPKTKVINNQSGWIIYCPGCKKYHHLDHRWIFNGDFNRPTFQPALLVHRDMHQKRCHSFITDGRIAYCSDSEHELSGVTVELPDIEK